MNTPKLQTVSNNTGNHVPSELPSGRAAQDAKAKETPRPKRDNKVNLAPVRKGR